MDVNMDGKRTLGSTKTTPQMKPRSVPKVKSKVDRTIGKESGKALPSKNSTATMKSNSSTALSVVKSSGKDVRTRSQGNLNELNADPLVGEIDMFDNAFQLYMSATALKFTLGKSESRIRGDINKHIAALQKRVNDNLHALEETRSRLEASCVLKESNDVIANVNAACASYQNEPAFTKEKSFEELLMEIDRINSQLPCKNVCIPETNVELANFQDATCKLLNSLESISSTYGSDQMSTTGVATQMAKIKSIHSALEVTKRSTDAVSLNASMGILNEATLKTSQLKIS